MRHYLIDFLLITTLVFTINIKSVLSAEPDIRQIRCIDVEDEVDLANFAFWLDGFISGLGERPFAEPDHIELLIEQTLKTCNEFPNEAVFEIVKRLKQ
ncbi:hypothetical protein [Kiloniella sp.]|uniref:hypothetical protein n=1 Tax=Kiloniella sp. TaxID=1938587 RepID=UPI003B018141